MREYNLALPDIVKRLQAINHLTDKVLITGRIVTSGKLSAAQQDLILALYTADAEPPPSGNDLRYGDLCLARESISPAVLFERLNRAADSASLELFNGLKVDIDNIASLELLPSDSPNSGIDPKYRIELSARRKGHLGQTGPLVNYGHLSFESVEQAVRAWIPLRPFHGSSDARIGKILIEMPLGGPSLDELIIQRDVLIITVKGASQDDIIELTGVWQSNDSNSVHPFIHKISNPLIELPRPTWAGRLAVWLSMPDSKVTDFFFEDRLRCSRQKRVLYPDDTQTDNENILALIQKGECENLEFKPFLRLDSQKFEELIRTVIAFSNRDGGTIFLGINNYQEIEGIETDLRESFPKEERSRLDECAGRYCAMAKTRICDRLNHAVILHFEPIQVCGKLLIRVKVEEGQQKPYSDLRTKEIWTRRGANTVRPDPTNDELKKLIATPSQTKGFFE